MRQSILLLLFILLFFVACERPTDYTDPKNRDLCGNSYGNIRYAERSVESYLRSARAGAVNATCLVADYDSNGICDYVVSIHNVEFSSGDEVTDAQAAILLILEAVAMVSSRTKWTSDKVYICNANTKKCLISAYTSNLRRCLNNYRSYRLSQVGYVKCLGDSQILIGQ